MKTQKEKLFEYAVIDYPTEDERKNGIKAEVVLQGSILAVDKEVATMKVVKTIPFQYDDRLDQVDIAIRPF